MPGTNIALNTLIPAGFIQLGRLVTDVREPCTDCLDPTPTNLRDNSAVRRPLYEQSGQNAALLSPWTNLAAVAHSRKTGGASRIVTDDMALYQLTNPDQWIKSAIKDHSVRHWIEHWIGRAEEVYLLTGYYAMLNPQVFDSTGPANNASHTRPLLLTGEHVCTLQYRKLRFRRLSSTELARKGQTERDPWIISWTLRSKDELDILDAELQDDLELEDDLEKITVEELGVFFM